MKHMLYHIFPMIGVSEYNAYGIEACEVFSDYCRDQFREDEKVKIFNSAISEKNGPVKLYYAKNQLGHSIYKSKNKSFSVIEQSEAGTHFNAPAFLTTPENVQHLRKYFKSYGLQLRKYCMDFVAENNHFEVGYDTKADLDKEKCEITNGILFSDWVQKNVADFKESFNILKINIEGAEYVFFKDIVENDLLKHFDIICGAGHDVEKVPELSEKLKEHKKLLDEHGIEIFRFSDWKPEQNAPMAKIILEKLRIKRLHTVD